MQAILLFPYGTNTSIIEQEEQNRFLKDILDQFEIKVSDFWNDELILNIEQKIKLKSLLTTFNLVVIDNDGQREIFVGKDKIAEFKKPTYILKKKDKKLFLEMTIDCWTTFEEER